MKKLKKILTVGFLSTMVGVTSNTEAATFNIIGKLTGDIRTDSPDNLIVDVTVNVNDTVANWIVDINSPLHPFVKLDEFYFNLNNVLDGDLTYSGFNPSGWAINSPATVQGAGGTSFLFEALDPSGPPDADDVTNAVNLSFTTTLNRNWVLNDFLLATTALSNDAGSGQMGAHLQSLTTQGNCGSSTNCSDSGFAFGLYAEKTNGGGGGSGGQTPEPSVVALMGIGLLGMGASRLRKAKG